MDVRLKEFKHELRMLIAEYAEDAVRARLVAMVMREEAEELEDDASEGEDDEQE